MSQPDAARRRLRWQCRRGMLELDLLLHDFIDRGWDDLDADDRRTFERLLGFSDQIIHDWLMRQAVPKDAELRRLIKRILSVVTAPARD